MKNSKLLLCILSNILQIFLFALIYFKFGEKVFIISYCVYTLISCFKGFLNALNGETESDILFFMLPTLIIWIWLRLVFKSIDLYDRFNDWLDSKNQIIK